MVVGSSPLGVGTAMVFGRTRTRPGALVARIVVTGPSIRARYELYVGIGKAAQLTDWPILLLTLLGLYLTTAHQVHCKECGEEAS